MVGHAYGADPSLSNQFSYLILGYVILGGSCLLGWPLCKYVYIMSLFSIPVCPLLFRCLKKPHQNNRDARHAPLIHPHVTEPATRQTTRMSNSPVQCSNHVWPNFNVSCRNNDRLPSKIVVNPQVEPTPTPLPKTNAQLRLTSLLPSQLPRGAKMAAVVDTPNDSPSSSDQEDEGENVAISLSLGKALKRALGMSAGTESSRGETLTTLSGYVTLGATLDAKLRAKIQSGAFVELGSLAHKSDHALSVNVRDHGDGSPQVSLTPSRTRQPQNIFD